jgi:RimJ/RimL family protein N-acetyltransferase
MPDIPTLVTERLTLRPMTFGDWPSYLAIMSSDRARYMGGPVTAGHAWGMFCADHAQWDLFGLGALMLDERATGRCVGQVGINSGPLFPEPEIGWFVFPQGEGRGYAFEAACALRDWARGTGRVKTLVSYIDPENFRSRRLAERLGARLDPQSARPGPDDLVYRHFG